MDKFWELPAWSKRDILREKNKNHLNLICQAISDESTCIEPAGEDRQFILYTCGEEEIDIALLVVCSSMTLSTILSVFDIFNQPNQQS
jgi:hypothetical protein